MKQVSNQPVAAALLLLASLTTDVGFASPDDDAGVPKGNGTLPGRMEGYMQESCDAQEVPIEMIINKMTETSAGMLGYSACTLRGFDVKSYVVEGYIRQWTSVANPPTLIISEVCIDQEADRADIVVTRRNSKPQHFIGKLSFNRDFDVLAISGQLSSGGTFWMETVDSESWW